MQSELKPCPFCGSKATLLKNERGYWGTCTNNDCDAETPGRVDPNEAASIWNRRAALSDKQAGEVKIKPLEFNDDPCPAAVCAFGHYVINPIYSHVELLIGYGRMSMTSLGRVQLNSGASIDDLQTAAQADYEQRIRSALVDVPAVEQRKFKLGDHVCKTKGSSWIGHVVGFYSTELTPVGYAVESSRERGSVQIYPEAALKLIGPASPLREGEDSAEVEPTHRHKKRGSEYVLIGIGKMQAEDWSLQTLGQDDDGRNAWVNESVDMREVAIYRSVDDGSLWVRPREEFEDGRFELIDAINAKGGE